MHPGPRRRIKRGPRATPEAQVPLCTRGLHGAQPNATNSCDEARDAYRPRLPRGPCREWGNRGAETDSSPRKPVLPSRGGGERGRAPHTKARAHEARKPPMPHGSHVSPRRPQQSPSLPRTTWSFRVGAGNVAPASLQAGPPRRENVWGKGVTGTRRTLSPRAWSSACGVTRLPSRASADPRVTERLSIARCTGAAARGDGHTRPYLVTCSRNRSLGS